MGAPAAQATAPVEVHHRVPRCFLRLRDRADAAPFDGEGIELAMEFEHEAMRWGVDPDVSRDELAAMVAASAVEIPAEEHRGEHAEDFRRWGRRGGLSTLRLYGSPWFAALAARRWGRITAEQLADAFAAIVGEAGGAVLMVAQREQEERRHEERECPRCDRGTLHADSFSVRLVPRPECDGTGRVTVYLYPARGANGGRS